MAFADTAPLVALLKLDDKFSGPLKNAQKTLGQFDAKLSATSTRGYRAGQQIGTGIQNGVKIAAIGFAAVTALLLQSVKEGQAAAKVQAIFAKSISNSGKVSQAQVAALNAQQKALLDLAGVDDELIKTEQTRLIQMGLTGDQVLKLTPLILDFSKATGVDLLTATKLVGKSVEGNTGALSRYGVIVDKTKAKTNPYIATQEALNKAFGGTTKALSGQLDTKLSVIREKLANVREEAGIKLLPVLTRIVDVVGARLVPAFGTFIDRILPRAITGLNKLAGFLESGGATDTINTFLRTAKSLAPVIEKSAEITGKVISTAVGLFKSLPPEIQSLAVAGLAINKLTGGLVTNIAGGLISAVLKQLVSGVVNVTGGTVIVNGAGVPGTGTPVGGGPSLLGLVGLGATAAVGVTAATQAANSDLASKGIKGQFQTPGSGNLPFGLEAALNNIATALKIAQGPGAPTPKAVKEASRADSRNALLQEKAIARNARAIAASTRAAGARFTQAVKDKDLSVHVNTNIASKTFINGRLLDANTFRYQTAYTPSVARSNRNA